MAQPYVGEIRMFGGNFAPQGWAFCEGQLLPVSQYDVLFSLIGTTYGGDGQTTFALPDLRGRVPIHQDGNFRLGQAGGTEAVTLTGNQIPSHNHHMMATNDIPTVATPQNNVLGQAAAKFYRAGSPTQQLSPGVISPTGGSQSHSNFQPYLCINFIISLYGIYPSPN